jgi:hypothetical protein
MVVVCFGQKEDVKEARTRLIVLYESVGDPFDNLELKGALRAPLFAFAIWTGYKRDPETPATMIRRGRGSDLRYGPTLCASLIRHLGACTDQRKATRFFQGSATRREDERAMTSGLVTTSGMQTRTIYMVLQKGQL